MIGCLFTITSCDIINPDEQVPSYIYVPEAELKTNTSKEGANTHEISDVWVYNNGKYLGTYAIPATIPVLEKDKTDIEFIGGILVNSISTTRAQYPFFSKIEQSISLTPKKFDTIRPTFQYEENTKFPFVEDFEDGNGFFNLNRERLPDADNPDGKYGEWAGYLHIPASTDTTYYFESKDPYQVPGEGAPVFVELDYKSDLDITAGLRLIKGNQSSDEYKVGIRDRDNWNKMYINYTGEITNSNANKVKVLFKVKINHINEDAEVFVDNIKLVY